MQKSIRRRKNALTETEKREAADALIQMMKLAVEHDNKANGLRKPAL